MHSRRARLLAGAALGATLLFLFLRGVDARELGRAFREADRGYLLAVVAATIVVYLARAWRWGYLLAPLGRVPFSRLFSATIVGFMTGLVIPRAGEVVRPYLVARRHDMRTSAAFASIILERLIDLMTVLVLFSLYLYLLPTPAAQTRGPLIGFLKAAGAVAGAAALAVLAVLFAFHVHADRAVRTLERLLSRVPSRLAAPLLRTLRSFGEGLAVLQAPPRHLLALAGQSLLVWLAISAGIHWNNRAFGLHLPFHSAFLMITFLTVGVAVPTPGMVGGFHAFYRLALTQVYGVSDETAVAAGIACHALTNLPVLALGLLFLGGEGLSLGKVARMSDKDPS